MAKVLYLSYDGMTDPLGQSQVLPYLKGLTGKGYSIHLISFEKKKPDSGFALLKTDISRAGIHWHPLTYHKHPPVLSTLYDLVVMYRTARQIIRKHQIELIHSRSYPPSLVALRLKQQTGIPFIFDMRGFWADERVEGNLWNLRNPIYKAIFRYFKKKEKCMLAGADAVVSLTENARQWIIHEWKHDITKTPVYVIPCCCDTQHFSPDNRAASPWLRQRLNINENTFLLVYLGSLGTWYLLDEMLDFFATLKRINPDSFFLFITAHEHELIRKKASEKGITAFGILTASRTELPDLIMQARASVFFIKPSFSKKASSPVKQAELMAMGVPIVSNKGIGDSDRFYTDGAAGVLIDRFDQSEYERAARFLLHTNTNRTAIRSCALKNFSLDSGIQAYWQIYQSLLKTS